MGKKNQDNPQHKLTMADEATMDTTPDAQPVVQQPEVEAELTNEEALRLVLRDAVHSDGIIRGIREVAKTISRGEAIFAVVANDCVEKNITKLVEALCAERKIPIVTVDNKKQLGEWAGLCISTRRATPARSSSAAASLSRPCASPAPLPSSTRASRPKRHAHHAAASSSSLCSCIL